MFHIMYGTHMKLEFKLADKQEQGFWLGEGQMLFIVPSPSLRND
jgi:hypothetical protein